MTLKFILIMWAISASGDIYTDASSLNFQTLAGCQAEATAKNAITINGHRAILAVCVDDTK